MCRLLTKYAIAADLEIAGSKEAKEEIKNSGEYQSSNAKLEKAQTEMETLFRRLQHTSNNPPDTRKFGAYFLVLRIIKI